MKDIVLEPGEELVVTFGEMMVGIDLPSEDSRIDRLKEIFAEAIDIVDSVKSKRDHVNDYVTYTMHKILDAQMASEKCLFLK